MKRLLAFAVLVPALALAQSGNCDPTPRAVVDTPAATAERLRQHLKDSRFDAVEDELADKLRRAERGEYNDLVLYLDILETAAADPALEPLLAQWVQAKPRSMVARLVKGNYHKNMGYARRGLRFAEKTSAEQFAAMEAEFKKAVQELRVAMELRPGSTLPHASLLGIARASAGADAVRGLLAEAEKVDRGAMAARYVAIESLAPKWGGSFEDQDAVVQRATKAGLAAPKLRYLSHYVEMSRANHARTVTKEKTREIAHYRRAAELCVSAEAWKGILDAAYTLEDWKTVKEAATQHLYLAPTQGTTMQRRGWAHEKLGEHKEATRDYEAAAELGEPWAQHRFGHMLMTGGGVPQDLPRARKLLESSAAKGNANARGSLEWLNRQQTGR